MSGDYDVGKLWKTMADQTITMLTTADEGGKLVSRPMAAYVREGEGKIYFLTRLETGKTEDIGRSAPVNLAFSDLRSNTYISVSGQARTSQDRGKLHELWTRQAEAWLPEGPDAPDTALITVDPEDATVWDSNSSRLVYAVKLVAALVTQSPPDAGRVEHVKL